MARKNRDFWESASLNNASQIQHYDRLTELSISMFNWQGLPKEIDIRYLELALFTRGAVVFFYDEDLGNYLALPFTVSGGFDVYHIPIERNAFADNGYHKRVTDKDSVIIYNNYLHKNSMLDVQMFARRLGDMDRTIDVNCNAQKTPIFITCPETEKLALQNAYMQYIGNAPVIMSYDTFDPDCFKVLKTDAPFVADKIYTLKTQYANEALTYLGISNINTQKKERLITDEVTRNQGGTIASRQSRLGMRKKACEQINEMFGLNVSCEFYEDYRVLDEEELGVEEEENFNE